MEDNNEFAQLEMAIMVGDKSGWSLKGIYKQHYFTMNICTVGDTCIYIGENSNSFNIGDVEKHEHTLLEMLPPNPEHFRLQGYKDVIAQIIEEVLDIDEFDGKAEIMWGK